MALAPLPIGPVPYTSYDGDHLSLYAWQGEHNALLTASSAYDPNVMEVILSGLDRAYEAYVRITGREPTPFLTYNGLASIAEVPTTFEGQAAAIGYIGSTGIEITPGPLSALYTGVRDYGRFDQALFYELGRNFFFYSAQIDLIAGTGFAIANRFVSMEVAGLEGGPFGSLDFEEFESSIVDGLSSKFFSSPELTIENTLFAGVAPRTSHNWSWHDFSASLLYQIYQNFGLSTYAAFYQKLEQLPAAIDKASAFTNLINAATAATGVNFAFLAKPAGVTYVVGSSDADILKANGSSNPVLGLGGADELYGSSNADLLLAGAGNDFIAGASGNDRLYGGVGSDNLNGGEGADLLDGGDGDDYLDGGGGSDTVVLAGTRANYSFSGSASSLTAAGFGASDSIRNAEFVRFLGSNETVTVASLLSAPTGVTITGTAANDVISPTRTVTGQPLPTNTGDRIYGLAGADQLNGGLGGDRMEGGPGNDTYTVESTGDLVIELASEGLDVVKASISYALPDQVEKLTLMGSQLLNGTGNGLNNTITGNSAANKLNGLAGNDQLKGASGNDILDGGLGNDALLGGDGDDLLSGGDGLDRLIGGPGRDTLTGNALADRFIFENINQSTAALSDVITDFRRSDGDRIDLAKIDANTTMANNQTFTFIGTNAFSGGGVAGAGELRYQQLNGQTHISGDVNGDGNADFLIRLGSAVVLQATDFIL